MDTYLTEQVGSNMSKKSRRLFSKEFKSGIAELVISEAKSVAELCEQHKLSSSVVYGWVKQHRIDQGNGPAGALTSQEKAELARLRKENRELKRERDFFEQATAYFSSQKR